jgi:hypothetical protein
MILKLNYLLGENMDYIFGIDETLLKVALSLFSLY